MRWAVFIPTIINVICAFIYVAAPRRHRHDYSLWSEWVLNQDTWTAEGVRYRHCRDCKKVQRQASGDHHCSRRPQKDCNHLAHLNMSETSRLEKELGL